MYFTNSSDGSVAASAVIVHDVVSPKVGGSEPAGPCSEVATPLVSARNGGAAFAPGAGGRVAGSEPEGPCSEVTTPLFSARNAGSALHSGQVGRASFRSPAISSRMKLDQISIAPWPAKYAARVVSTSWAPVTE